MRASVAFNRPISTAYLHLGVAAPGFPETFRAGEFVMVRPAWIEDPFLPRAFSIYRITARPSLTRTSLSLQATSPDAVRVEPVETPTAARPSTGSGRTHNERGARSASIPLVGNVGDAPVVVVEILYKVLGKGTQCLARMEPGQEVEILGPLGNSFTLPDGLEQAVLVAGGIGVPPIAALAVQLAQFRNPQSAIRNVEVFLGGKTHEDILCVKDFEEIGAEVHIATEDASLGVRGLVTDLLRPFLLTPHSSRLTLYTCGPPGMLAAVAKLAEEFGVPCQASVEANMACGFGACMGCAVEVKGEARGYKLVCKDGPVFDSREIVWK